jgi:hypothetical protein
MAFRRNKKNAFCALTLLLVINNKVSNIHQDPITISISPGSHQYSNHLSLRVKVLTYIADYLCS